MAATVVDHAQRLVDALAGLAVLGVAVVTLAQKTVVLDHLEGGGQVVLHELADLRSLGGLVVHRTEDLRAGIFQLIQLGREGFVGNLVVLDADLLDHLPAPVQQFVHLGVAGIRLHLLQAFGLLVVGGQIQPLRHDAHNGTCKKAQNHVQQISTQRMGVEDGRKQGEHRAKGDDSRAHTALLLLLLLSLLLVSHAANRSPSQSYMGKTLCQHIVYHSFSCMKRWQAGAGSFALPADMMIPQPHPKRRGIGLKATIELLKNTLENDENHGSGWEKEQGERP